MKALALLIFILFLSNNIFAATPSCYSGSGGHCQYNGKVHKIYISSGGLILIYFENPVTVSDAGVAGIIINSGAAAAFNMSTNPDFAKMFYSTALAAQASGRSVTIQMRGTQSGYLQLDRIWLSAP